MSRSFFSGLSKESLKAKLAEIMDKNSDAIFEPFFRSKAVADEITRRQTVPEQMKWTLYFAKWGCLICETKDATHDTLGMCQKCHRRIGARLTDICKHAQEEQEARGAPVIRDLVEEARNAIGVKEAIRRPLVRRS